MAVSIHQLSLVIAAAYHSMDYKLLKHKQVMLLSLFMGTMTLTACQTAPFTASNSTASSTTTITQTPETIDNTETSGTIDYPIEPYISSNQTISTAPSNINQSASRPITPSTNHIGTQNPLTQQPSIRTNDTQQLPNILSNDGSITTISPSKVIINEPMTAPSNEDYIISQLPAVPPHNELLERARQNSQQQARHKSSNKSNLPAFRNLMQTGTNQLKAGKLTEAESTFTRAQRLAPRSSAVYFYLSQVALKKNQPRKAEAMARRGLSVSQDSSRRNALWQLILQSGQQQNNPRVIREAQQALR